MLPTEWADSRRLISGRSPSMRCFEGDRHGNEAWPSVEFIHCLQLLDNHFLSMNSWTPLQMASENAMNDQGERSSKYPSSGHQCSPCRSSLSACALEKMSSSAALTKEGLPQSALRANPYEMAWLLQSNMQTLPIQATVLYHMDFSSEFPLQRLLHSDELT